jgi:hypothetical protein
MRLRMMEARWAIAEECTTHVFHYPAFEVNTAINAMLVVPGSPGIARFAPAFPILVCSSMINIVAIKT